MRAGLVTIVLAGLAAGAAAQTHPRLTEEATTARGGRIAIELAGDFMAGEPNYETGKPRSRWDGPWLRLVYSPADSVEIDVEWVAFIVTPNDPDFGSASDHGDVTLRTKLRFRDGGERGFTWGARFAATLPQTSFGQGLGPNTTRTSAQLLATMPTGPLRVHANAGLAIQDEVYRAHEQRDFLAYGAAAEWRAAERLTVVSEVAGLMGRGRPGTDAHHELRAGLRLGGGRRAVAVAVRRGLGDADGTWGATAGLTWVLRSPLR